MRDRNQSGVILPLSLLMALSILAVSGVLLDAILGRAERVRRQALQIRAEIVVKAQIQPLVRGLGQILTRPDSATALLAVQPTEGGPTWQYVCMAAGAESPVMMQSIQEDGADRIEFQAAAADARLRAGLLSGSGDEAPVHVQLAWTFESPALWPDPKPPPQGWPLPDWHYLPQHDSTPPPYPLQGDLPATQPTLWVAAEDPLPFSPQSSPALVPVPVQLSTRFSVFASGAATSRQKEIRIRLYLEGSIWNPYNRPLRLHSRTGLQPQFQAVFAGFPALRIHNRTQGFSTGWLEPDQSVNAQGGAPGIHGWVRMPATLAPGQVFHFEEPDLRWQPEGLARTLHPGFPVGPGDRVTIEFKKMPEHQLLAALVSLEESDPLQAAQSGRTWFSVSALPVEFPELEFSRADNGPRPFYIHGGSLAFRKENCQLRAGFRRPINTLTGRLDPRRKQIAFDSQIADATGRNTPASELVNAVLELPPVTDASLPQWWPPLYSWPDNATPDFIQCTDWLTWPEGQRIGAPSAALLNDWLARAAPSLREGTAIELFHATQGKAAYIPALPVNCLDPQAWSGPLGARSHQMDSAATKALYPRYPTPDLNRATDWAEGRPPDEAAQQLVDLLQTRPARSLADFFNHGYLEQAIYPGHETPPLGLSPLRGWLSSGQLPAAHPAVWVLHLYGEATEGHRTATCAARVWLLQAPWYPGVEPFEIMRFEWMDPLEGARKIRAGDSTRAVPHPVSRGSERRPR